jgi:hypothetical protein
MKMLVVRVIFPRVLPIKCIQSLHSPTSLWQTNCWKTNSLVISNPPSQPAVKTSTLVGSTTLAISIQRHSVYRSKRFSITGWWTSNLKAQKKALRILMLSPRNPIANNHRLIIRWILYLGHLIITMLLITWTFTHSKGKTTISLIIRASEIPTTIQVSLRY